MELIRYLNDNYAWDFFMVVFEESDRIGHLSWKEQKKVKKVYQKLDGAIGEIFSFISADSIKLIFSDHGFKSIKGYIFLNEWLFRRGYVKKTFKPDKASEKLLKNLNKFKEDFHKKPGKQMGIFKFLPIVDYENSLAYLYSPTSYGIRINLKKREPKGIVEEKEYENLRNRLIAELKDLKDPLNQKPLFQNVFKKEEVIGASDDDSGACDIYFLPMNMDYFVRLSFYNNSLFRRGEGGFHSKEGIFFAIGDEFKQGFDAKKLSILDITPTILHLLNVEVPQDIDGKVRKEIFHKFADSYKRKVRFGKGSQKIAQKERFSQKEEEKAKERLRALGYIE